MTFTHNRVVVVVCVLGVLGGFGLIIGGLVLGLIIGGPVLGLIKGGPTCLKKGHVHSFSHGNCPHVFIHTRVCAYEIVCMYARVNMSSNCSTCAKSYCTVLRHSNNEYFIIPSR